MKINKFLKFVGKAAVLTAVALSANTFAIGKHHHSEGDYINVPEIEWQPCFIDDGNFECAAYEVPLVHSPWSKLFYVNGGEGIELALIRIPAADQEHKIGSIFFNPGGPGGSGVNFILNAGQFLYTPEVREKFDFIGFDPRGINFSNPLSCFTNFDHIDMLNNMAIYPETPDQIQQKFEFDKYFRKECRHNAEDIIDHMTTADVARDMDILRQAVGDKKLNYAGYSYGSYLGVTYANLFPNRVRSLIVDAVLDPIAWSTGYPGQWWFPFSWRLRSDAGAKSTLDEYFRLCDLAGAQRCAFAGNSAARYDALIENLKADPLVLPNPDGTQTIIDHQLVIVVTLQVLYNSNNWQALASDLSLIELLVSFSVSELEVKTSDFSVLFDEEEELVQQTIEGGMGVFCSDTDNPYIPFAWPVAAQIAENQYGYFGKRWTWLSSPCANWPGSKQSRYAGPFNHRTSSPVLVMNTLHDPATRYEGAQTVHSLMPKSHLVSVEGWGHATLFLSSCATQIASDYLVDGVLPEGGESECQQDFPPFQLSADEVFGVAQQPMAPQPKSLQRSVADDVERKARIDHRDRALRSIGKLQ